jgi:hypothetical protein
MVGYSNTLKNKITKSSMSVRDQFILEKAKYLTPTEIAIALKGQGFAGVTRGRVYQILKANGITPKRNRAEYSA